MGASSLHYRLLVVVGIFIFSLVNSGACTVPVFRYALDQWPGTKGESIEDPPILAKIADHILAGNSAVWIQIDSGNRADDDAAFERLQGRLKFFESVAELPEIDPNDPSSQLGPGPKLEIKFTVLRIDRTDPVTEMIVGSKADSLPVGEAWIAPIFGRGRVLGVWEASRMDEEGIDEACFYLTGACSCQVKVQNPGWDLAMNVEWDERLRSIVTNGEDVPAPIKEESAQEIVEESTFTPILRPPTMDLNFTYIIAAGLIVGAVFLLLKKRKPTS